MSLAILFHFLCASACNTDTTPTQPHRNSNTHRTKNNTTNVVIQQNSRKLLMMDIFMSETCRAHNKWNKIASDIKLVFYSSTITMMHCPINVSFTGFECSPVYRLSWQWFSLVSSVPPGKFLYSRLPQIGHTRFFPRSYLFFVIHRSQFRPSPTYTLSDLTQF